MKAAIVRIDKGNQLVKEKEKNTPQNMPVLVSNQMFDNFGKSEISINAPQPITQKPTNQPPGQKPANNSIVS
jgi:hypothetical protein